MNPVELVDDIAQKVTTDHAVLHALKHSRNHLAPVITVGTRQRAQVTEQARAFLRTGQRGLLIVNEGEQFVAGNAIGLRRPIAPAVRRFDGGLELFPGELGLALALNFQVVQKFQEHDPGEHRQPVKVAIEPLVFAHDVARGF